MRLHCVGLVIVLAVFGEVSIGGAQSIQWERTSGPGGGLLSRLDAFDDGTIFVAQSDQSIDGGLRMFKSSDSGKTWGRLAGALEKCRGASFVQNKNLFFAADQYGYFYYSTDGGTFWTSTNSSELPFRYPYTYLISHHDTLYWTGSVDGVFRSTDSGRSWVNLHQGLPYRIQYDTVFGVPRVDTVVLPATDLVATASALLLASQTGVYESSDAGNHWFLSDSLLKDSSVLSIKTIGDTIIAATVASIWRSSDNGGHWQRTLPNKPQVIAISHETASACMQDGSFYVSDDAGLGWTKKNTRVAERPITSLGLVGSLDFVSTAGQGVLRSENAGVSWSQSNYYLNDIRVGAMILSGNTIIASGVQCGIFRSEDGGQKWNQTWASPGTTINVFYNDHNRLFAADDNDLYSSTDDGRTWKNSSTWTGPGHERIEAIGRVKEELIAGAEMGWFVSADSGITWSLRSTNCGAGGDVAQATFLDDTIWDANDCTFWVSSDAARTWNAMLPHVSLLTPSPNEERVLESSVALSISIDKDGHNLGGIKKIAGAHILCVNGRLIVGGGGATNGGTFGNGAIFQSWDLGQAWQQDTNGIGDRPVNDLTINQDTVYASTEDGVYRGVYRGLLRVGSDPPKQDQISLVPRENSLYISLPSGKYPKARVSIYDVLGRKVWNGEYESDDLLILPSLRHGGYLLRVSAGGYSCSLKIVY